MYDLKIEPILEDDPHVGPRLMRVVVADLAGTRRDITKIFKLTKSIGPEERLKHIRRIRNMEDGRVECILASVDPDCDEQSFIHKVKEVLERDEVAMKAYRVIEVPATAAKTNSQLEYYSRIWPVKYTKSEYLIKCIEGSVMDDLEKSVVHIIANGLIDHLTERGGDFTSGAVIFRYAKIYGVGLSCGVTSKSNPTKHSPMLAIDSVARNAGSGHWSVEHHQEGDILMKRLQHLLDVRPELTDHKMDPNFLPYICTDYDIVITEEPCLMCTMGLVQSRFRRLFYFDTKQLLNMDRTRTLKAVCFPDKAIEEFFIHRDKSINHRFEAWRIKLLDAIS